MKLLKWLIIVCFVVTCMPAFATICSSLLLLHLEKDLSYSPLKEEDGGASGNLVYLAKDKVTGVPAHVLKVCPDSKKAENDYYGLMFLTTLNLKYAQIVDVLELHSNRIRTRYINGSSIHEVVTQSNTRSLAATSKYQELINELEHKISTRFPESIIERRGDKFSAQVVLPPDMISRYGGNWSILILIKPDNVIVQEDSLDLFIVDPH